MFEPAKNKKASDFSEALILLGRDGEIIFNDLLAGASTKSLSRGAAAGLFMGATLKLRLACAHKKSLTKS
ncbi:MAG: hypothetical protein EBT60_08035 [Bacteroidetes bacterium]|nr:hypothetical protein [Bacteroidota bacterium]